MWKIITGLAAVIALAAEGWRAAGSAASGRCRLPLAPALPGRLRFPGERGAGRPLGQAVQQLPGLDAGDVLQHQDSLQPAELLRDANQAIQGPLLPE
jgi:phage/plasmid primase-like uncharacterized protein